MAFDDPEVEEIDLMWATQTGKTTVMLAMLNYIAANHPGPAMFVSSNEKSVRILSKTRLYPMLEECPKLKDKLLPKHLREDLMVDMEHMLIFLGWSGSSTTLGEKTCRYVFGSELDKWSTDKSMEADPEQLFAERTKAFPGISKIVKEGTPTIEGSSRINRAYMNSNQQRYYVPCPSCGEFQTLDFKQVKGGTKEGGEIRHPEDAREHAYYECVHCQVRIDDSDKMEMLRSGLWVPRGQTVTKKGDIKGKPLRSKRNSGFQLSSLYSNTLTFGDVLKVFLEARDDIGLLQNVINSWFAEPFKITDKQAKWEDVKDRLETGIEIGTYPPGTHFLTAGIDVQGPSFYFSVWAFGDSFSPTLVTYGEVETESDLTHFVFDSTFSEAGNSKKTKKIRLVGMDSGFESAKVYDFVNKIGPQARAVKGQSGRSQGNSPWTSNLIWKSGKNNRPIKGGIRLWHINTEFFKDEIYNKLEKGIGEPGCFQFTQGTSNRFYRQLCSEGKVKKRGPGGRVIHEYKIIDTSAGNHFLDTTVYALAMADMCGIRNIKRQQPDRRRENPNYQGNKWLETQDKWL